MSKEEITRQRLANTIRILSADAVQQANSGHPGAPMGMADIAEVLWNDFLNHNPANPNWHNRDRFVLSNGHGSMLIYSLLYLSGYDLSIEDVRLFRQLHSKTPGHPEYGYTPGVETTTGPLGQGLANAIGLALAEKVLAAQFNRPGHEIVNHKTYVFLGDGCLMEGVSHEVCSLAGTLGLSNLIAFWDDNGISIDGEVEGWFTDDTAKRFESYGWDVIADVDGHNFLSIQSAIKTAHQNSKPTLICCRTIIGKGSPNKQGKEECHGAALGKNEVAELRKALNWSHPPFDIPVGIKSAWDAKEKGQEREAKWNNCFDLYQKEFPELASEYLRRMDGLLHEDWVATVNQFVEDVIQKEETIASRKASLNCLEAYSGILPELLGGSADLAGSNYTICSHSKAISAEDASGNYLHFGVREFGMSAIINGISLHGGFKAFGATFLVFSDYARNAVRMSSLMKRPVTYIFTHDSIGLGEDGPTHQPVEHVSSLRLIPNLSVWRPCDALETAIAWRLAIESMDTPFSLILSRQSLPFQARTEKQIANVVKGGYILMDCDGLPELILLATGSEVGLATKACEILQDGGVAARVVSMPSLDHFDQQDDAYKESVLPASVTRRIAIEAGSTACWYKYVGKDGDVVGMDCFGESAPANDLFRYFNITVERILEKASALTSNK